MMPAPFDNAEPYELTCERINSEADKCPPELYAVMEEAADNIRAYQSKLKHESQVWKTEIGTLGQLVRPLERVGVYVPGGTAAYPSSLLMCVIPAKSAGVREVVMCTPPTEHLNPAVFAAARISGVDRVFAVGGIQAIAAMTYGAGYIPRVDKIIGPGNAYVQAAKRFAFGTCDIDMLAGPSDILVIANADSDPAAAAADMLSQAEHDKLASSVLVTDSAQFAQAVASELQKQLLTLPRREIAENSIRDYGAICVCEDLKSAVKLSNAIAPEHLELLLSDELCSELLPLIENAGAVFVGAFTPEPLGDYFAGPSHILPTLGAARFSSALSFESFTKRTSIIGASQEGLRKVAGKVAAFARAEDFEAHARAVEIRFL